MKNIDKNKAKSKLEADVKRITDDDVEIILKNETKIEEKFKVKEPLQKFFSELKLLFSLVKEFYLGTYKDVPWWSVAAIVTSLLYVLNPIDFIPDFIPGLGYIDDAMIVGVCLNMVSKDIEKYKKWKFKKTNTKNNESGE